MYIYYWIFIIIWYALTVNFLEWLWMLAIWITMLLICAFIYWINELIKEDA